MFALSVEKQILDKMREIDLSADNLSALSREFGNYISAGSLSQAFRGARHLDNDMGIFLVNLLRDVESLILANYPVPISLKNPSILAQLLRDMRDAPPDLPTLSDLILMNSVLIGQDFEGLAAGRHITVAQLRESISEISVKTERAAWRMGKIMEEENATGA